MSGLAGVAQAVQPLWHWPGLAPFILIALRVTGLIVLAPGLSTLGMPPWLRGLAALWISAALWPTVPGHGSPVGWALLPAGALQLGLGLLMGLVLAVPLWAWEQAGYLLVDLLGLGLAASNTPGVTTSPNGLPGWFLLLAFAAFLAGHGLTLTILALHASFQAWPLAHLGLPRTLSAVLGGVLGSLLAMSLTVAAPALAVGVAGLVAAGIVSRTMPQAPIYFVALPAVILSVLAVAVLATSVWLAWAPAMWQATWTTLSHVLTLPN